MRTILRTTPWLAALATAVAAQAPGASLPADRAPGAATIDEAQLRAWLTTLTSPELAGRGTGQEGFRRAAELVRDHFASLGLEPMGDDGAYWQAVPWTRRAADPDATRLIVRAGDDELLNVSAADGLHGRATADASDRGRLGLVVIPDAAADLDALDLRGEFVLVWVGRTLVADGEGWQRSIGTQRAYEAVRRAVHRAGGKLIAVADDELHAHYGPIEPTTSRGAARGGRAAAGRGLAPAQLVVTQATVRAMLDRAGIALPDPAGGAAEVELPGWLVDCDVEIRSEQAPAYNVVARLAGRDPALRDEYVAIGCHLDHLGERNGTYFPGADDDGSGSAGLLAVAQAFARNPERPRRSVLFMAFCGEEMGLLGSEFLADNPPLPLENMVAELQMDMIGRNADGKHGKRAEETGNFVYFVGLEKLSSDFEQTILGLNEARGGFEVSQHDVENVFSRSDHFNFARHGIPIAFFFTGFHPDYHRPTDTVDKIEFDKLRRIATFVYDAGWEIAEREVRPTVDPERWQALRNKARRTPVAPLRR